jgi:hypothetical protein
MNTFTIIFSDEETGKVRCIVTGIRGVRHINPREVAITELNGQRRNIAFNQNEKLEVIHREVAQR